LNRSFKDIFVLVFPLTGLLFGAMTYFLLNLKTLGPQGLWMAIGLGFACGMVFGIGVGYFVRSLEITFEVDPTIDLHTRLQLILLDMGYRLGDQFQKVITFEPTVRAGIFADRIRVEFIHGTVRMDGPRWHLERLREKLGV
jgi:NhaP-type Na+/H+ or K+/H+ antiporter